MRVEEGKRGELWCVMFIGVYKGIDDEGSIACVVFEDGWFGDRREGVCLFYFPSKASARCEGPWVLLYGRYDTKLASDEVRPCSMSKRPRLEII